MDPYRSVDIGVTVLLNVVTSPVHKKVDLVL